YENLKDKQETFLAFTGLKVEEFQILLKAFTVAWENYVQQNSLPANIRQRDYGGGRKARLETFQEKLLFILVYFKTYPLQEVIAFHFDMSQSQACEWIHVLSEVLKLSLSELGHTPERDPQKVKALLESYMDESGGCSQDETETDSGSSVHKEGFGIDGTERRRQRPKDAEEQKRFYSGKKKTHTVKNNVIVTLGKGRVEYLGSTWEGKKHDKSICDEEGHEFPEGSILYKDTGFQGYEPAGVDTLQPKKKPRGGELTSEEKEQNSLISKVRIIVEHVLCGVKRSRIVKDVFRNTKDKFDDLVMEIACGLHNFRTACRTGDT
ncbi:MAG: transposase, partial [Chloroflexi bacterium]|nr:transposase [Chloroflexota bacterium]